MRAWPTIVLIMLATILSQRPVMAGCVPDQHDSQICGEGHQALRIFPDTTAPSGRLAFGWRTPTGLPSDGGEPRDSVEDVLVGLPEGQVLATLGATYWTTGQMRPNRDVLAAVWSPDSKAVVEISNSRWSTDSFRYYAIAGGTVAAVDLLDLTERALRQQARGRDGRSSVLRVREDVPAKLDAHGRLSFSAMLFVPKSEDGELGFKVVIEVQARKAGAVARIVSVRRAKLPS